VAAADQTGIGYGMMEGRNCRLTMSGLLFSIAATLNTLEVSSASSRLNGGSIPESSFAHLN
jgi:hypothetical protein